MTLKTLLQIIPEGQWIILTVTLTEGETYGFYYRKLLEQIPHEYYDNIVYMVRASANNTLEVCI